MTLASLSFYLLVLALLVLYYLVPKRFQWVVLLIGSYAFYAFVCLRYMGFIVITTLTTYFGARGMDAMTAAMEPLQEWQGFRDMMEWARNPFVGVLVGAGVTALLQSSSASVGILQALAATGAISLQASLFILFGQNIGT